MFALKDNRLIYNVGIYVRLSRDDGDVIESESIANQKNYLIQYVLEQGWNLVDVFVDDGYTGTNFNRPGFIQLIKAIEDRKVNLVITKDLSRLGRDYIDTGHYVERYFPSHNVRYIALNDGVDTFETNNSNNDMSPFKSVMNDFYARDISKKVRTSMNTKRRNGQFIGSFTPYGYLKSPSDKNKLIVDEKVAPVVKQIFRMYLNGSGYTHIAHVLNDQQVPCPSAYKESIYPNYKNPKALVALWSAATIKTILLNPTYSGSLTQQKYATISYKVKKQKALPRESWLIVEGTHEPIVTKEAFETVQRLIANKTTTTPPASTSINKEHLLGGLLYCRDCGSRMTFTKTQKGEWYCICSNYKRFKRCTRHSYLESSLEDVVTNDLKRIAQVFLLDEEDLLKEAQRIIETQQTKVVVDVVKEKQVAEKRIAEIKKIIQALFEDKVKGTISERDFIELSQAYNKERDELLIRLTKESPQVSKKKENVDKELLQRVRDLIEFKQLTKGIIVKLIDRIEVAEEGKNVDIYYTFKDSP